MKPLKPSLREKKRYLLVEGKTEDIEKAILEGIGVLGMSKIGLSFIKSNKNSVIKDKKSTIVSINRDSVNFVRASFAIWPEKINVKKISGSIKGLEK
ncbi:hypothetical protein K0A97_01965 [Patescibacteria group bacterium]|nr:hypothetical protein [Patescibacteria group bacterium]